MINLNFLTLKKPRITLSEFQKKKGFETNKSLAIFLGISESYLSHFYKGTRKFGRKTALRIHKKTGISLKNLIQ